MASFTRPKAIKRLTLSLSLSLHSFFLSSSSLLQLIEHLPKQRKDGERINIKEENHGDYKNLKLKPKLFLLGIEVGQAHPLQEEISRRSMTIFDEPS